ncbi:hypothetical protein RAH41_18465 [Gottfriedia acidiceleris]|uniref:hypothetical protein n=1 Tax=Gottfriedia acidiceleris TaxID=371036 RepID=UPI002F265149
MSVTLYFSKVNINSHILKVYDDKREFDRIIKDLYIKVKDNVEYIKEIIGEDEEGNTFTKEIVYKFNGLQKFGDDLEYTITGRVIKKMTIFINDLDEKTGQITKKPTEHVEVIEFHYDLYKEVIAFHIPNRFGYVEFNQVFRELLNQSMSTPNEKYNFEVSLFRKGLSVESIKQELKKIGKIATLRIDVIPPNPDEELLDSIHENGENYLEQLKKGKITQRSIAFSSTTPEGLDIDAEMIDEELEQIGKIHSKLSSEEAIEKGYITVEGSNVSGRTFTTNDTKPVKDKVDKPQGLLDFAKVCKNKIASIFLQ